MGERGFAWVRVLIAVAILVVLGILANQVLSASKTPLRTIRIGPDIVVHCKARESVVFTGFTLNGAKGPTPFLKAYLGPVQGNSDLEHGPPDGVPLRLRFAINEEEGMLEVGGVSMPANSCLAVHAPLPGDAQEIPDRDDVLEYVHTTGKVELNVDVEAGRLVIHVRRPG